MSVESSSPAFKFQRRASYLRQSAQKECPHGSLTGLVHSPRQMPHSLLFALDSISTYRSTEDQIRWPSKRPSRLSGIIYLWPFPYKSGEPDVLDEVLSASPVRRRAPDADPKPCPLVRPPPLVGPLASRPVSIISQSPSASRCSLFFSPAVTSGTQQLLYA